jgi:hypothetical protein
MGISWFLALIMVCSMEGSSLNKKQQFFLWFLHLDFIYLLLKAPEKDDDNTHLGGLSNTIKFRKMGFMLEAAASIFVTTNSIFVGEITAYTSQISLAISIFDFTLSNALILYVDKEDKEINQLNWKDKQFLQLIIPATIQGTLENAMLILAWGFLSVITRPWGSWSYFAYSFFAICISRWLFIAEYENSISDLGIICRMLFEILIYVISSFGIYKTYETLKENSDVQSSEVLSLILHKIMLMIGFAITFVIFRTQLQTFVEQQQFWMIYFILMCCCFGVWIISTILLNYKDFKRWWRSNARCCPFFKRRIDSGSALQDPLQ